MTDKKKKPEAEQPSEELLDLRQQVVDVTEALQRERADATNIRRRHDEQIAGLKNTLKANIIRDLLPVIDNFERSLKHVPEFRHAEQPGAYAARVSATPEKANGILKQVQDDVKKYDDYIKGVQGVVKQFETVLANLGVERIKTTGEPFDPKYHEAVSMDEDSEGETEVVSEELQSGYKIGDEVIRHAMVRVKME